MTLHIDPIPDNRPPVDRERGVGQREPLVHVHNLEFDGDGPLYSDSFALPPGQAVTVALRILAAALFAKLGLRFRS